MNTSPDPVPDDATLIAWLDDEATPTEVASVDRALATDARVRGKVELLRAARLELADALTTAEPGALATSPEVVARLRPRFAWWLAAAAALVTVIVLGSLADTPRDAPAAPSATNEFLEFRVLPARGGWPLFSGIRFDLEGRAKTALPCRIVARRDGESDEQLTARIGSDPAIDTFVPLVLEAELTGPDGEARRGPVVRVEGTFGAEATRLRVELVDVVLPHASVSPFVAARLEDDHWVEDFLWGHQRVGETAVGGNHGCVPEHVGDYQIRFSLRSFATATPPPFATFPEPLATTTAFTIAGAVGAWSTPQDGLRARIVASSARVVGGASLALAAQLRNESDRPRAYNVAGVTLAPIPQPFHFDLLVDGETWTQRDDLAVMLSAGAGFLPQPVDTMRSVLVLADYWQHEGKKLSALTGKHQIGLRFHFEPTAWAGDDTLWQGQIETPPITVDLGPERR